LAIAGAIRTHFLSSNQVRKTTGSQLSLLYGPKQKDVERKLKTKKNVDHGKFKTKNQSVKSTLMVVVLLHNSVLLLHLHLIQYFLYFIGVSFFLSFSVLF